MGPQISKARDSLLNDPIALSFEGSLINNFKATQQL